MQLSPGQHDELLAEEDLVGEAVTHQLSVDVWMLAQVAPQQPLRGMPHR